VAATITSAAKSTWVRDAGSSLEDRRSARTTPYTTSTAAAAHSAASGQLPSVTISLDRTSSARVPSSDWFNGLQLREASKTPTYGSRDTAATTPVASTACAANTARASSGGPAASVRPVTQIAPSIAVATPKPKVRRGPSCSPVHGDDQSRRSVGYKAGAESSDNDLRTSA